MPKAPGTSVFISAAAGPSSTNPSFCAISAVSLSSARAVIRCVTHHSLAPALAEKIRSSAASHSLSANTAKAPGFHGPPPGEGRGSCARSETGAGAVFDGALLILPHA